MLFISALELIHTHVGHMYNFIVMLNPLDDAPGHEIFCDIVQIQCYHVIGIGSQFYMYR